MRNPSGRQSGNEDLVAGVAAAAAFLLFVFLLHVWLWVGALLAVGVYVGVRLLVQQLNELCPSVPEPRVRSRVAEIGDQAGRVLEYLDQHAARSGAWRPIVRECLESTLKILQRYVELSRFADAGSRGGLRQ